MHFLKPASSRRNVKLLFQFLALLLFIIIAFSLGFHAIMAWEGQDHSWVTGFYWTMTTMSTLGFGDITFLSDFGKIFSVLVLMTGMIFLLVLLPFTFIEFFYSPWIRAQEEARAPRKVPSGMRGHVILSNHDPISAAFILRLKKYNVPYVLVVKSLEEALRFADERVSVVMADLDDPAAFENLGLERAVMLVATSTDVVNTSVAFTARALAPQITIVGTANAADSVDVLELAGCDHVIQLGELLGASLARRTIAGDAQAHIIGEIDDIRVAEATAAGTPLVGKSLRHSRLREKVGLTVIGIWEHGGFRVPMPDDIITETTVLVLAGTEEQINRYNELFCIYHRSMAHVIIIGAGRVGRATGNTLSHLEMDYRIVDKNPDRFCHAGKFIPGSGADLETLERAGIRDAPAVIITTREDDVNIYLTIYCRKLRPDIQIIARSTLESNTQRLHRAGADFVMSYATMGAGILFNLLRKGGDVLMVAEGLNVFRMPMPRALVDAKLADSRVRELTGCSVIALQRNGKMNMDIRPDTILEEGDGLVLIGTVEAENLFLQEFCRK